MIFEPPLIRATLLRRYQRFLGDVRLDDGQVVTVHVPNTGSMKGCSKPGAPVWLSHSDKASRKYPYTLEIIATHGVLTGVNPALANTLVREALEVDVVEELAGYASILPERRLASSRLDFLLEGPSGRPRCWVEVKSVTLVEGEAALFPDAVSARALKHLEVLEAALAEGCRAVIFFLVQRSDGTYFAPAESIDPAYAHGLRHALAAGVEALAYWAEVSPRQIRVAAPLPCRI